MRDLHELGALAVALRLVLVLLQVARVVTPPRQHAEVCLFDALRGILREIHERVDNRAVFVDELDILQDRNVGGCHRQHIGQ